MEKLQILFPEPQLLRLRRVARKQDRPVSELVRAAVDSWLDRHEPWEETAKETPPRYHCGTVIAKAEELRDLAYHDRAES
ncbi:MAG: hypothetical protein WCT14_02080 [Treponemataceae bacterium]